MSEDSEHLDVVVVGAGISGIDAAYHLMKLCPKKTFVVLERRDNIGGTWDLFKYPGLRSDSEMYTFGYGWHPWIGDKIISQGENILAYLQDCVKRYGIDKHLRFGVSVKRATWSSASNQWCVETTHGKKYTSSFLFFNTGYYKYDDPYVPDFPGQERFQGPVIHPQKWTPDIDYKDKKVVIIGSGATAATMLPVIARDAEKVTMLQRSPGFYASRPNHADLIAKVFNLVSPSLGHSATRYKNIVRDMATWWACRNFPGVARWALMSNIRRRVPKSFDVDTHFNPSYNPWDQRICLVPDGDFFRAIRKGKGDVVTDRIKSFTETGVELHSGKHLEADMIITATGLNLQTNFPMSDIQVIVDGEAYDSPNAVMYKGVMLSDIPNFCFTLGYANASWTLKADLASAFFCRVLNHMERSGYTRFRPLRRDLSINEDSHFFDLNSGYLLRAKDRMPKQADPPWRFHQNWALDMMSLRFGNLEDGFMEFVKTNMSRL